MSSFTHDKEYFASQALCRREQRAIFSWSNEIRRVLSNNNYLRKITQIPDFAGESLKTELQNSRITLLAQFHWRQLGNSVTQDVGNFRFCVKVCIYQPCLRAHI